MTVHERIRPFNTKDTYPEQNLDNDLCQAVKARGTMVFLRGQVSQDLETRGSLHVGDAGKQAGKAMANIKMLLEEAGASLDHVCRIVVYLTDIRYRDAVYQEMGKWLGAPTLLLCPGYLPVGSFPKSVMNGPFESAYLPIQAARQIPD